MSKSKTDGPVLTPEEITVGRLVEEGFAVFKLSLLMLAPDGTVTAVNEDGSYSKFCHLADAMRAVGRPASQPIRYNPDGEYITP